MGTCRPSQAPRETSPGAAIVTKTDGSDAVGFDREAAAINIQAVRPGMETFAVSPNPGELPEIIALLESGLA